MSLFKPATNSAAFLKMGILGFAGSGKTWTASMVAMGLHKAAEVKGMPYAGKPVFFIDTEGGSSYIQGDFADKGIDLQVVKTRAFSDLIQGVKEAEQNASVLIIDSISHFWIEFQEAYARKKNRRRGLEFADWSVVKQQWRREFTEPYLNTNLHIIMCGRAGHEYNNYVDDAGKKQIEKSGVKMSAEKELGFEPSLLVLMEHEQDAETHAVTRKAFVMKDRFRVLDGKSITNPTFKSFADHIGKLNWGGKQEAVDTSRTSDDMIEADKRDDRSTDRAIVLEMIDALAKSHLGTSQADKKTKHELYMAAFGTVSETCLQRRLSLEDLQSGYDKMHLQLEGRSSPFELMNEQQQMIIDEIPFSTLPQ